MAVKFCNPPLGLPEWSTLTGGGVSGAKRLVERGRRPWLQCATSADEISWPSPTVAPALTTALGRGSPPVPAPRARARHRHPFLCVRACVWIHWEHSWQPSPSLCWSCFRWSWGGTRGHVRKLSQMRQGRKDVCCRSPWPFVHGCCWRCQGVCGGGVPPAPLRGGGGLVPRRPWHLHRACTLDTPSLAHAGHAPPPLLNVRVRRAVCWKVPPRQPLHKRSPLAVASTAGQLGTGTLSPHLAQARAPRREGPRGRGWATAQTATLGLCARECVHPPTLCTDCQLCEWCAPSALHSTP